MLIMPLCCCDCHCHLGASVLDLQVSLKCKFIFVCTANPDTQKYVGRTSTDEVNPKHEAHRRVCDTQKILSSNNSPNGSHPFRPPEIRILSHVLRNKSSLFGCQKLHLPLPFPLTAVSSPFFPPLSSKGQITFLKWEYRG